MASDTGQRNTILLVGAAVLGLVVVDRAFNGETPDAPEIPAPVKAQPAPAGPSPALMKIRAEREVRAVLKDPDSASFSGLVAHTSPALAVCGYVNSKNGFGGMTGNQRFISGTITALEEQMPRGEMDKLWDKVC